MHRFTCGEKEICRNIKKPQNIIKVVVGLKLDLHSSQTEKQNLKKKNILW